MTFSLELKGCFTKVVFCLLFLTFLGRPPYKDGHKNGGGLYTHSAEGLGILHWLSSSS